MGPKTVLKLFFSIITILGFSYGVPCQADNSTDKPGASDELLNSNPTSAAGLDDLDKLIKEKENEKAKKDVLKKTEFTDDLAKFQRISISGQTNEEINALAWSALTKKWNIVSNPDAYRTHTIAWDEKTGTPILTGKENATIKSDVAKPAVKYIIVNLANDGKSEELDDAPADLMTNDDYKTVKLVMRRIPAGEFTMGSPDSEDGRGRDELQHKVLLTKDFFIGIFEVTQEQWKAVVHSNPSQFKNAGKPAPVENVSWTDCKDFIGKLNSRKDKYMFCLPTEAEWEYACRAGSTTRLNTGDSDSDMPATGWYCENSGVSYQGGIDLSPHSWVKDKSNKSAGTHAVGQKVPNAWGLYDMHGNVLEWCSDWYGEYSSETETNPAGAGSGSDRVFRGGGWLDDTVGCRSANRNRGAPGGPGRHLGFRCQTTIINSLGDN